MFERVAAKTPRFVGVDALALSLPCVAVGEFGKRLDESLQRFALRGVRAQFTAGAAPRNGGAPLDVQPL